MRPRTRRSSAILALALGLAMSLAPAGVLAAPPTPEDLVALGQAVRGTDAAARREALDAFAALGEDALPALTARVAAVRRERRTGEDGYKALGDFARAAGASSQSEGKDVVAGFASVLDAGASAVHGRVAERVLLLRALERIGTARAVIAMLPILMTDMIAFRWEARHLVKRMGRVTVAALIRAASSPVPEVDVFAGWGFAELGVMDAGHAVQDQTAESLSEIIRAYADVKHLGAMPMVASFVGDDRLIVREAAHDGMIAYAENGIWQLRALHQSRLSRPSPAGATFRDLLARLEAQADDRRAAPFRARMSAVETAFANGHLDEAVRLASDVEARANALPELARLAPIHAAFGARALEAGRLDEASQGYRRALLLAPDASEATAWSARLTDIETARLAQAGIEPWPDAPVLAAVQERTPAPSSKLPLALALIGLTLLSLPRVLREVRARARMPEIDIALRRALETLRALSRKRARAEAPEETMEEEHVPQIAIAPVQAAIPAPDAAQIARERLARAAAEARARIGSIPPTARADTPIARGFVAPPDDSETTRAIEAQLAREAQLALTAEAEREAATVRALEEAAREAAAAREAEIARAIEAEVARELEAELAREEARASAHAEAARVESKDAPVARRARPTRRASIAPELLFGAPPATRKRA